MSYEDVLRKLSENTRRIVLDLYGDGTLSPAQFRDLAAILITMANEQGRLAAELSLKRAVEVMQGSSSFTATAERGSDKQRAINTARITGALQVIQDEPLTDQVMRIGRLAAAEPLTASQRAYNDAMKEHPDIGGWSRGLESDACQLCIWWDREGRIWPVSHDMPTHVGCVCTPIPETIQAKPMSRREG